MLEKSYQKIQMLNKIEPTTYARKELSKNPNVKQD